MKADAISRALSFAPSAIVLLAGLGYLIGPIDLIPDRTPYIGHLDEAGCILVSLLGALMTLPPSIDRRAFVQRIEVAIVSRTVGRALFRLSLGRWPDGIEQKRFTAAIRPGSAPLPVILRGLLAVPAARDPISRFLLHRMMREGRLPRPARIGSRPIPIAPQIGDPLSFWEGPPISFMHLEKTAGTALADVLTRQFHPLQIDPDPNRTMPPHMRSAFPTPALSAIRERKLVWGHYDLPSLLRLGPDRAIVTMLREPRTRILSLYQYWRSVDPAAIEAFGNHELRLAHELDLLAFLRHDDPSLRDCIENLYVRRLTGAYRSGCAVDRLAADPAAMLGSARQAIRRLAFVGIVERMDASLAALSSIIDTPLPDLGGKNTSEGNASADPGMFRAVERTPVSTAIEAELDRLTSLDRVIYAECLQRLEGA